MNDHPALFKEINDYLDRVPEGQVVNVKTLALAFASRYDDPPALKWIEEQIFNHLQNRHIAPICWKGSPTGPESLQS